MYRVSVDNGSGSVVVYTAASYLVGEYSSYNIIDPVLTLADNEAGSFVFTLPPNNVRYDASKTNGVRLMESEINIQRRVLTKNASGEITKESWENVWRGRPISEESDFEKNRIITCEGELNYLKDTRQPQRVYDEKVMPGQYLENLLKLHNSKVNAKKAFYYGGVSGRYKKWVDSFGRQTTTEGRTTQFQDTFNLIKDMTDELGGHIVLKRSGGKRYLYLYDDDDWKVATEQSAVRLGDNLLDFSKKFKMDELATVIIPLGEKKDSGATGERIGAVIFDQESASTAAYASNAVLTETTAKTPTKSAVNPSNPNQVWDESSKAYVDKEAGDVTDYSAFHLYGPYNLRYNKDKELIDKVLYYTGRMRNGYVKYLVRNNKNEIMAVSKGSSGSEPDDTVEEKIEIPDGSTKIWIAGYGDDISLRLNQQLPEDAPSNVGLDEYTTVESVNKNSPCVINNKLVSKYGWVEKVVEFPGIDSPSELLQKAKKYLRSDQFEDISLEVKMIDKYYFDMTIPALKIGNVIRCISEQHDLDEWFPVSKMEIHLLEPDQSTYTLGLEKKTQISVISSVSQSQTAETIKVSEEALSGRLMNAKKEAFDLIANSVGGVVTLKKNPDTGKVEELIISEYENYLNPAKQKIWRWNKGGLAFSNKGYNAPAKDWGVAITANGEISADRIVTGTMSAERIEGGTLTIGDGKPDNVIEFRGGIFNKESLDYDMATSMIIDGLGINVINPYTGVAAGWLANGGLTHEIPRGKYKGLTYRDDNGAEDFRMTAYYQMLIESQGHMFLIVKGSNKRLYTGRSMEEAYNNNQYGQSGTFQVTNGIKLRFENGLFLGYET